MGHLVSSGPRLLLDTEQATIGSLLDGLDPRGRILAAAGFAITTVSLSSLPILGLALMISLTALAAAKLPARATLRRMAAMDGFILVTLATLPFTVPGTPLFQVLSYPASLEGLLKAAEIALKANAIILMLLVLVGTLEPVTLGHALFRLKVPANLVHLLMFTVRYIAVLHQEFTRLMCAMRTRGFELRNSLHTYRSIGYLVGMMLVRSVDRSERILAAMKCRGFVDALPMLDDMRFSRSDVVFGLSVSGTLAGLVALEWIRAATY